MVDVEAQAALREFGSRFFLEAEEAAKRRQDLAHRVEHDRREARIAGLRRDRFDRAACAERLGESPREFGLQGDPPFIAAYADE